MPSPPPWDDQPLPIALANTITVERRGEIKDLLGEPVDRNRWLRDTTARMQLSPDRARTDAFDAAAVARLVSLRDAVRTLAASHTQDPRTFGRSPVRDVRSATSIINSDSALTAVWPELRWNGSIARHRDVWSGGTYIDAVITVLARHTIELAESPEWEQLYPCVAPNCAHFFVKNNTRRQWCSAGCGNRARVARHTQRARHA
ncbi:CGNR zinc finger domain-containing protein [Mycobacterium sp. NPDC003449]